jgi:two-component system nitrate/nitrite response regulator NarL
MSKEIRVAILEDHQSIIDGYLHRLSQTPEIVVVDYIFYGVNLELMLAKHAIDVLILDIHVPTSAENKNPYPILYSISNLLEKYPALSILVISMHDQPTLISSVMDAGVSGYVLKDDIATIQRLGEVVITIAHGGIYLSKQAYQQLHRKIPKNELPSPRQLEILSLSAAYPSATTTELANRLNITNSTARNLFSGAYVRLGVQNRTEAILKARRMGLLTPIDELSEV